MRIKIIKNSGILSFFFLLIIYSFLLSLLLPARNWETDFGSYYSLSMFLDENNILYNGMFSHSGPFYFVFIKFLNLFLGWGWRSSIITYAIIYFLYFLVVYFKCLKLNLNFKETLLVIFLLISYQKYFGTNICLQNFFNILLILFSTYLLLFINENFNKKYFFIAVIFFSLLVLTRIDGLLYSLIIVTFYLFYLFKNNINFKIILKDIFLSLCIFLVIFLIFKFSLGFTLRSYFTHNVLFNLEYSLLFDTMNNFQFYLDLTPKKLTLLIIFLYIITISLLKKEQLVKFNLYSFLVLILVFLFSLYLLEIKKNYFFYITYILISLVMFKITLKDKLLIPFFFSIFLYFVSISIFNYSGSYKLYHTAMLHPSYLFVLSSLILLIKKIHFKYIKYFFLFLIIFFITDQYKKHFKFLKNEILNSNNFSFENSYRNFYYFTDKIYDNEVVKLKQSENLKIICGRGWINIFSNKKVNGNIYDWWYFTGVNFKTEYFNNDYKNFIKKKLGEKFIIDKSCTENKNNNSTELKYILNNSIKIKDLRFFNEEYELRKLN